MTRATIGGLLAAVVVMAWGAVWWVVLPFQDMALDPMADEHAVVRVLDAKLPRDGVYLFPAGAEEGGAASGEELALRHRKGPVGQLFFHKGGLDPMAPEICFWGYVHLFLSAMLMAVLLRAVAPSLPRYRARVAFVGLAGLFAAVALDLSHPIWLHHPWRYWVMMAVHDTIGWTLAGLVLAHFIRPGAERVNRKVRVGEASPAAG